MVYSFAFSPDGKTLLARTDSGTMVWTKKGAPLYVVEEKCSAVSDDGEYVYTSIVCEENKNNRVVSPKHDSSTIILYTASSRANTYLAAMNSFSSGIVEVWENNKTIRLSSLIETGWHNFHMAFRDENSIYAFVFDRPTSTVRVILWNFRTDSVNINSIVIDCFRRTEIIGGKFLFVCDDSSVLNVYDLSLIDWQADLDDSLRLLKSTQLPSSYRSQYSSCGEYARCDGAIYDLITEDKCMYLYNLSDPFQLSDDFSRLAHYRNNGSNTVELVSLAAFPLSLLALCCSELPPYVILLIYNWLFVFVHKCKIETAERWFHGKRIEFICTLKERRRGKQ